LAGVTESNTNRRHICRSAFAVTLPIGQSVRACYAERGTAGGFAFGQTVRVVEVPRTRYVSGTDGAQIAYQIFGDHPLDLVYLTGTISHVDVRWEDPSNVRFLEGFASFSRVISFDRRGVGASDRLATGKVPTWEEWAEDMTVVLDAAHSEQAALFAIGDGGGKMAITFAATHPARVRALILFHGLGNAAGYDEDRDGKWLDFVAAFAEQYWGTEEYVPGVCPSVMHDPVQRAWWAKYMRATATPHAIAEQMRLSRAINMDFVLPSLRVPTLVMHRSDNITSTLASARALTERIPNATFLEIPGVDAAPATQGAGHILNVVQEFVTGLRPSQPADRFLATVLFTDIVDSTRFATRLGDRAWRELLDAHDQMVRSELRRFQGREITTTGDGFLATFDAPGRAIHCGKAICDAARKLNIEVRVGLHTGEVEARGADIGGISVHIGARVAAAAAPGEVLVSRTVTDLVAGSGIEFEDQGERALKGVPGTWRLFSVSA
jgi:class 3 adenylate cyclase